MSLPEKAFPVSWDQFHRDARALAWRLADGDREWLRQFGADIPAQGARNDTGRGIALDAVGDVFVAGDAIGSFGTPGRNIDRTDWFVLKLKALDGSLYE